MVSEAAPENAARDPTGTSNAQSKRVLIRFGFSTLLMVMSLVATLIASETNRYRHRRIVEASYGSALSVHCAKRFGGLSPDGFFASSLTKLIGSRWNEVVVSVTITEGEMSDRVFDSVTQLNHVRNLGFWEADLNASQLKRLAKMKSLRWLYFLNTNVDQENVEFLRKSLPNTFVNEFAYNFP